MIDIITKLCMSIGNNQEDNNELYESKKEENWKLDVVKEYLAAHIKDKDWRKILDQCVEMSKAFGLEKRYEDRETWKLVRSNIIAGIDKKNKNEEVNKASRTIQTVSDYGCGSSRSYGCGSSGSYGCGVSSRRSSSYGCGSLSSSYGC